MPYLSNSCRTIKSTAYSQQQQQQQQQQDEEEEGPSYPS